MLTSYSCLHLSDGDGHDDAHDDVPRHGFLLLWLNQQHHCHYMLLTLPHSVRHYLITLFPIYVFLLLNLELYVTDHEWSCLSNEVIHPFPLSFPTISVS